MLHNAGFATRLCPFYVCVKVNPISILPHDDTIHLPKNMHVKDVKKSNRKAMNRNWSNQKANPALKTKAGNK